jgi:RNA polymerase sigma-70 factor (ECF subfamily)
MGMPGSQRNVERLVNDHYASLYRYAYRLAGSTTDAEDLTQETFCTAQQKLRQLRDPERVKAWLFSILRNAYLRRLRDDKHCHFVPVEDLGDVMDLPPDPLLPVEPERLQQALNELPEVFRTPIILYYFEEFSYRDIAEQMDLPLGTVMSRLARAKAHLRTRLVTPASAVVADTPRRANDGL